VAGDYKKHVWDGQRALCGNRSFTTSVNSTDCARCNDRVDSLLALLLDAAAGKDVRGEARELVLKWRLGVVKDGEYWISEAPPEVPR
jgi:hypothetical protein